VSLRFRQLASFLLQAKGAGKFSDAPVRGRKVLFAIAVPFYDIGSFAFLSE
jgi:hypothetical protein